MFVSCFLRPPRDKFVCFVGVAKVSGLMPERRVKSRCHLVVFIYVGRDPCR
jgi:hypothetical protein